MNAHAAAAAARAAVTMSSMRFTVRNYGSGEWKSKAVRAFDTPLADTYGRCSL
jgi:hypothetical protein